MCVCVCAAAAAAVVCVVCVCATLFFFASFFFFADTQCIRFILYRAEKLVRTLTISFSFQPIFLSIQRAHENENDKIRR